MDLWPQMAVLEPSWEAHFFHSNIQASGKDEKMMRVLTEFCADLGDSQQAAQSIVALFASKAL